MTESNSVWDSEVPAEEIEAAADALKILWESEESKEAVRQTGHGAGYLWLARAALEAALRVRGKNMVRHDTKQ